MSVKKLASIAVIMTLIGLIGMFIWRQELFSFGIQQSIMETSSYEATEIDEFNITMDVVDFKIKKSTDQKIHVLLEGKASEKMKNKLNYDVHQEDNTLFITLNQRKQFGFDFTIFPFMNWDDLHVVVQVPEKNFDYLRLDTNVADIDLQDGNFSNMDITSDVGNIKMVNMTTDMVSVEANVGDIEVIKGIGGWNLTSDVGESSLHLTKWNDDITMESDVGDIELEIDQMPSAYTIDLSSNIGDIDISELEQHQSRNDDKNVYVEVGIEGPIANLTSDVGDIEVKNN